MRNVKSFDLLMVEHALKAVLRPYEASFWLYYAARDYTGKTDELIPQIGTYGGLDFGHWMIDCASMATFGAEPSAHLTLLRRLPCEIGARLSAPIVTTDLKCAGVGF